MPCNNPEANRDCTCLKGWWQPSSYQFQVQWNGLRGWGEKRESSLPKRSASVMAMRAVSRVGTPPARPVGVQQAIHWKLLGRFCQRQNRKETSDASLWLLTSDGWGRWRINDDSLKWKRLVAVVLEREKKTEGTRRSNDWRWVGGLGLWW